MSHPISCLKARRLGLVLCLLAFLAAPAYAQKVPAKKVPTAPAAKLPGAAGKPLEFVPGSWTIVLLPDVQHYSQKYPGLLAMQADWILRNKERHNIQYVCLLGDITNANSPAEWEHAREALGVLDGKMPYAIAMGNHDCGRSPAGSTDRETPLNRYFPAARFKQWPTFGGVMQEGRVENCYHLFRAGGSDWIILVLEWAPRDEVVAWANTVLDKHPGRKAVLVTHAYLYDDNTRYDFAAKGKSQAHTPHAYAAPGSMNDGEQLWQKLVKKHDFAFVFSGHVLGRGTGFLPSANEKGRDVAQMLVNYQMRHLGGEGYLRLVEMLPDGKTVQARSYSPLYDKYLTEPDQQFNFRLE